MQVDDKMWYIDFSFLGCLAAYIGLLGKYISKLLIILCFVSSFHYQKMIINFRASGFMTIVIAMFLKYLGVFDVDERTNAEAGMVNATSTEATIAIETLPLVNGKEMPRLYGASDQEDEPGSSFNIESSDNLNGGKMCVVCYDDCRNCFFAPCGHFTTCFTCAQR